jgi:hypothetical protein
VGWTIPGRDKSCGLDNSRRRQELWVGQFPAETRVVGWTIPGGDKILFSSSKSVSCLWDSSQPHIQRLAVVKRSGLDVGHSSLSSSQVRNEWSHPCASPIFLPGVHRETFTFIHKM